MRPENGGSTAAARSCSSCQTARCRTAPSSPCPSLRRLLPSTAPPSRQPRCVRTLAGETANAGATDGCAQGRPLPPPPPLCQDIVWQSVAFTETKSTFLQQYEVSSGGDWAIHRGGAFFVENAEAIAVTGCTFNQVGMCLALRPRCWRVRGTALTPMPYCRPAETRSFFQITSSTRR